MNNSKYLRKLLVAIHTDNITQVLIILTHLKYNKNVNKYILAGLEESIKYEYINYTNILVKMCVDINELNGNGRTSLIESISTKNLEIVKILLRHGADVNAIDKGGFSPLMWAAYMQDPAMVKLLLEHGANTEILNTYGVSPLIMSIKRGNEDIIQALIQASANVNLQCKIRRWTALMYAVYIGDLNIASLLLKSGADPNICAEKSSPLSIAIQENNIVMTNMLISYGAQPTIGHKFRVLMNNLFADRSRSYQ